MVVSRVIAARLMMADHTGAKAMRLLPQKYKTFEGAAKRAAFERAMAPSEFRNGYKARLYCYRVVEHDGAYRVERFIRTQEQAQ